MQSIAWQDEYTTLIDDCEKRESKLTEWEATFIDSLKDQISKGRRPSQRQSEILDEIWENVTLNG